MDGRVDRITERRPYNAVSDFVDSHIAAGRGNKAAFVDPERSLTYGELQARSIRFANALRDLGIGPEQRVALLLNDTVDYPVAFWGAIRAGCVAIPLNIYLTLPQYAYILADCRAQAIVADAALADAIRPVLETLPRRPALILVDGTTIPRAHAFEKPHRQSGHEAPYRGHRVGRGRLLVLHLGLDRRPQGRQARPFQPDGDREAVRPGHSRHYRE